MVLGARFDPATRCLLEGSDIMNLLPMVMMLIGVQMLVYRDDARARGALEAESRLRPWTASSPQQLA
jgi:hypothetical protein